MAVKKAGATASWLAVNNPAGWPLVAVQVEASADQKARPSSALEFVAYDFAEPDLIAGKPASAQARAGQRGGSKFADCDRHLNEWDFDLPSPNARAARRARFALNSQPDRAP